MIKGGASSVPCLGRPLKGKSRPLRAEPSSSARRLHGSMSHSHAGGSQHNGAVPLHRQRRSSSIPFPRALMALRLVCVLQWRLHRPGRAICTLERHAATFGLWPRSTRGALGATATRTARSARSRWRCAFADQTVLRNQRLPSAL